MSEYNCRRTRDSGACCRDESKMVRCAATALEKMKTMFEETLNYTVPDPSCKPKTCAPGCMMDAKCKFPRCPFRGIGVAPNELQTFCSKGNCGRTAAMRTDGRSDRNAMRLFPGEVGLRGDRATFRMDRTDRTDYGPARRPNRRDKPAGAVYYNLQNPESTCERDANTDEKRKHVMQVLPSLPASGGPAVGPVTGWPIGDDEHVFVLRLNKRHDEPDEKARLQIEMRIPKHLPVQLDTVGSTEVETQTEDENLPKIEPSAVKSKKKTGGKKKSGGKKKAGK